ncbi:phytanoyl-CoA dioxygenase family protein [Streptomyces noursei]|uniref:phytanoyl-CoA dioxygenase family protein n=1 Tax=Streptomyces noursei TaxID=1971 RepID=UPI0033F765A2
MAGQRLTFADARARDCGERTVARRTGDGTLASTDGAGYAAPEFIIYPRKRAYTMVNPPLDALNPVGTDALLLEAAQKLGLTQHLLELELNGFTVVPPEKVASPEFTAALRDAVLETHRRRTDTGTYVERMQQSATHGLGDLMPKILWDDPIFETALMNPVVQTLARAMAGHTCRISVFEGAVKAKGDTDLTFHADTAMTEPYPIVPQHCNVTYALSDYSREHGSTMFVPGSHKLLRQPVMGEVTQELSSRDRPASLFGTGIPEPVAVECPAGSIIAWYGATWHGASPRTVDGHRISMLMYFCRWYLKPQTKMWLDMPEGALERNSPRFAQCIDYYNGWEIKEPSIDPANAMAGRTVFPILDVPLP